MNWYGIDEDLLDSNTIATKMNTFSECYQKLNQMMPTCLFKISGDSIIYSALSEYEPEPVHNQSTTSIHSIAQEDDEISI